MLFQNELNVEVAQLLRARGLSPDRTVINDSVKFSFEGFELWIYPDGANVLGPSVDRRFEIYDFDSLDHMKQVVLAYVATIVG